MPEYILWRKGDWGPYSNGYQRFPEKDITAAAQKACEMIESWAKVLTEETRFVLEEVKFIPLPNDKWIINCEKKKPKVVQGLTVTTECMVMDTSEKIAGGYPGKATDGLILERPGS